MQHFSYFLRAFLIKDRVRILFSLLVGLLVCNAEFIDWAIDLLRRFRIRQLWSWDQTSRSIRIVVL